LLKSRGLEISDYVEKLTEDEDFKSKRLHLKIKRNKYGKPFLKNPDFAISRKRLRDRPDVTLKDSTNFNFNVSHKGDFVVG